MFATEVLLGSGFLNTTSRDMYIALLSLYIDYKWKDNLWAEVYSYFVCGRSFIEEIVVGR